MSPLVVETSLKAGESSPSTSEMERLPVAVVVAESSVTEPVKSPETVGASSAPVMVTVMVCSVLSVAVKV